MKLEDFLRILVRVAKHFVAISEQELNKGKAKK